MSYLVRSGSVWVAPISPPSVYGPNGYVWASDPLGVWYGPFASPAAALAAAASRSGPVWGWLVTFA